MEQLERDRPPVAGTPRSVFDEAGSGAAADTLGSLLTAYRDIVSTMVSQDSERYVRSSAQHGAE